ncbi:MAG: hypothetical protein R3C01_15055, partial [Planctomycetaceae bacterium]
TTRMTSNSPAPRPGASANAERPHHPPGVQAVEACTTSTVAALQTGTACEDRDAEAEVTWS